VNIRLLRAWLGSFICYLFAGFLVVVAVASARNGAGGSVVACLVVAGLIAVVGWLGSPSASRQRRRERRHMTVFTTPSVLQPGKPCGDVGPRMTVGKRNQGYPKCNLTLGHTGNHELLATYSFVTIAMWTRTGRPLARPGGTKPSMSKTRRQ
jgi:predicted permease